MQLRSLLALLIVPATISRAATSPFGVTPSLQTKDGASIVRVAFNVPADHYLYADRLSFDVNGQPATFTLPKPATIQDHFSGETKQAYTQPFEATFAPDSSRPVILTIRLQGCDEANCYFPEVKTFTLTQSSATLAGAEQNAGTAAGKWQTLANDFTITARGSGYLNERAFLSFLNQAESGRSGEEGFGRWGVWATLGIILLGGLGLNLTPCILPLIPINLAILGAGAKASSRRRGFALGGTYALGMAIAYGVLGAIVVLTGSKFGTLNSSPWFNLSIAGVFGVLAAGMFGLFNIDFSRFQSRVGTATDQSRSKYAVAYAMGSVAALLAGACVAPVVISVLVQSTALYNRGVHAGLTLPFLLGVGMGLPWPFAGAGLSFLPKPGRWMNRVKHGFGALIVLFALYYGYLSFELFRPLTPTGRVATASQGELTRALEQARATGKPVFIDFWASWCKNCTAMEHTTFASARVRQQLSNYLQVRLDAEQPNQSPAKELLDYFGAMGLPTYVVLTPKKEVVSGGRSS